MKKQKTCGSLKNGWSEGFKNIRKPLPENPELAARYLKLRMKPHADTSASPKATRRKTEAT